MKLEVLPVPSTLFWMCAFGAIVSGCEVPDSEFGADASDDVLQPTETFEPPVPVIPPSEPPEAPAPPPPSSEPPPSPPAAPANDDGFRIQLVFGASVTPSQEAALEAARRRWEEVIVEGLPDATVDARLLERACGLTASTAQVEVDDLIIVAETEAIDGPGQVLGQAGPCLAREEGSPLVGVMFFDEADLDDLERAGRLEAVLLHEMGHVLGIGTLWSASSLVSNPSLPDNPTANTRFVGPAAAEVADILVGSGASVPVENGARPGSSDGHWRESVFRNELMTPFLDSLSRDAPLSELTVASLEDLGFYVTNRAAADPFRLPTVASLSASPDAHEHDAHETSPCQLVHPAAYVSSSK